MKILLLEHPRVICPERCNDIANTPLSSSLLSGYIAAMLISSGHQVEIVEGYLDRLNYLQIENTIKAFQPDILGVHMVYHWEDNLALYDFLQRVKDSELADYLTVYGFYPTFAYEDILQKCGAVDSIIIGEPELTFAELAAGPKANYPVAGLAMRGDSGEISYERRPLERELDKLPFPIRTKALLRLPEVNLLGSRGCYGRCTFCYINPFYGQESCWRGRSPENIIAEIDRVIAETGIRDFYFTDPNFFGPGQKGQARALRLAELLKIRNIRFGIEGRVNDIHDETIEALVAAGLRHILIGLESGKDSSLQRMNKMTTVAQNELAIKILRKHGIEPNVGFIMFEPDATLEDLKVNFEFLKRNDLLKNLPVTANVLYHHQIILKGTPSYQKLLQTDDLVIQNTANYEGQTNFRNPQVEVLAKLMRRVTNFLFNRMAGIWGGTVEEPEHAKEKYAKVNHLLVDVFEKNLNSLLAGQQITDQKVDIITEELEKQIDSLLR